MIAIDKIKESIILLAEIGDKKLVSDLLCALAAITNTENPRADLTYSSVMRHIRNNRKDIVNDFQSYFKQSFEDALDNDLENPEQLALMESLQKFDVEI